MKFLFLFIFSFTTYANAELRELYDGEPVYHLDGRTHYLVALENISPLPSSKKIFFQNNKILPESKVDHKSVFCFIENIRRGNSKAKIIKKDTVFKINDDKDHFEGWEKYLSYRIWQKRFFFWDNGDFQYINCSADYNSRDVLDYKSFKLNAGKYFKIIK